MILDNVNPFDFTFLADVCLWLNGRLYSRRVVDTDGGPEIHWFARAELDDNVSQLMQGSLGSDFVVGERLHGDDADACEIVFHQIQQKARRTAEERAGWLN